MRQCTHPELGTFKCDRFNDWEQIIELPSLANFFYCEPKKEKEKKKILINIESEESFPDND